MAKRPTITTVASGYTSQATIDTNFEAVRDQFDNTLSLDGSTPNAMGADFDLNGNDILNGGTLNADSVVISGVNLTTEVANAAASATAAAASATAAEASSVSAAGSASSSSTSATASANSATAAANSATAAATAETNAETAETGAASSASAASTSASNAATSATNAATSETNAATSAVNAATSETNAANSATAAAASEANVIAIQDAIDDTYLGAKASEPTVDNDGDPLTAGDWYFNTTDSQVYIYNGSSFQAVAPDLVADITPQLGGNLDAQSYDIIDVANLIIGAASGTYPLEVNDTNGNGIAYRCSTNSVTNFLGAYNSVGIVGTLTNHPFAIWTNNAARVTVDATGQVGIGTSSPFADLHVQGAAPEFRMYSSNTTGGLINFIDQGWQSQIQGSAGHLMFMTGGTTEGMRLTSGRDLGLGTTSPSSGAGAARVLEIEDTTAALRLSGTTGAVGLEMYTGASLGYVGTTSNHGLALYTNNSEAMRINSSGNIGHGTSSPDTFFHSQAGDASISPRGGSFTKWYLEHNAASYLELGNPSTASGGLMFSDGNTGNYGLIEYLHTSDALTFYSAASEAMRIDSSGNLLLGATSGSSRLWVENTSANDGIRIINGTSGEGYIIFGNSSDSNVASIAYNHASNFMSFDVNNSEAARIDSSRNLLVGKTSSNIGTTGFQANVGGDTYHVVDGNVCVYVNRLTSDGDLIQLRQAGVTEGSISVSGTTVSYNGAHLSRWFQVPGVDYANIEDRPEILRGSVLTNLDEMCDWEGEDNEQLNKMEVSSVKGDKNVAGVFQDWDDDDDAYLNDGYCAMTGDFVIRIAADCTVERGDLLMSAGDGTACPQEGELADVVRSCTVAKVTSTTVSHTYEDGSYLVPCVLMAC